MTSTLRTATVAAAMAVCPMLNRASAQSDETKTNLNMSQKERSEIADQYKWNVADLYATDEAWRSDKEALAAECERIADFKGRLGRSAKDLADYMEFEDNLSRRMSRLFIYTSLKSDVDLRDADMVALTKEMQLLYVDYVQKSAFARPELAAIPNETLDAYMAAEPRLAVFAMDIDRIKRGKEHTLSDAEEALLAKVGIMGNVPESAYSIFSNAEMPWPTVELSDGRKVELNQAEYSNVRASACRADREKAMTAFWENYRRFEGTFGELMNGNVRQNIFSATARNYASSLEAALSRNNIPTSVYHSLIDNVNRNLPTFHRYLKLKKRMLGVDTLKYSDLYAPCVNDIELKYTYDEAQQLVLEAVRPLGDDYAAVVRRAFAERWIDVYPNAGKTSGAYSNGGAYDVHPYILMNYNDQYENVGTLIHELGHTMHSYLSNTHQPHATADYAIFVAEVASTFNEALLDDMMLRKLQTKGEKLSLLMSMLDGFKGTLFRQTQFAEFELAIHQMAEEGQPLTGKVLSKVYGDIVRKYYGHELGVCSVDDCVALEWAFIPHFYMGFYVYQYSTSFVASQALAHKTLSGDAEATRRFVRFLSSGGSKYPIDLLKDAGVDMTTSEPFDEAIRTMNELMDEIEKLLAD